MAKTLYAIAAGIQSAGDIDDRRAGIFTEKSLHQTIQHDGTRDNAAAHRAVFFGEGKIIVEPSDNFLGLFIANRAARPASLARA